MLTTNKTDNAKRKVAIIGASSNEERYAYKAQKMLMDNGYTVIPVSPTEPEILGVKTTPDLADVKGDIDTVTLYVGPKRQADLLEKITHLNPQRVLFNPGTENPDAYDALDKADIDHEEACTLVLLRTGQF